MNAVNRAVLLATAVFIASAVGRASADDLHLGVIEYEMSCLPCHGLNGRGDGPNAKSLAKRPADLTILSRTNHGVFPTDRIAKMIDGRAMMSAHGEREMPIWGNRYRVRADEEDTASGIEKRARSQIAALVRYIRSIQRK